MLLIGNAADALTRKQWTSLSRMSAHLMDAVQGLTTLKLLGRSRDQIETIAQISDRFRQTTMAVLRVAFMSALALEMLATISTAVVAVQIGLRLLYGRLEFEQALFVLLLAPEFYLPLRLLGTRFHAGMEGVTAARRIFEVLDTRPATAVPIHRAPPGGKSAQVTGLTIGFDNVYRSYDEGQRPALNGLSLQIPPGAKVALVGPSGAGKSTVAHLLLRFVEPERGEITAGATPLSAIPPADWRRQVAWVPQRPYLFASNVEENIRLARPEADAGEILRAATQAHAHEFIMALPAGYATPIGERGARLSGGQAQRIALARAFLKDAPLLVLDEATANLDPATERMIQESLRRLLIGRTALVIAHRLNTVMDADQIFVLQAGRVVQSGNHQTLSAEEGLYQSLIGAFHPARGRPDRADPAVAWGAFSP